MPHVSWMIERLNSETRAHHANADSHFDVLFADDVSTAHYIVYLTRTYGFEAALEAMLSTTPNLGLMIDLHERAKSTYLAQDMLALGLRPHAIAHLPQCLTIPELRGAAEALGWMYVVERMTLAHSVVRRHLLTKLPREMHYASSYFQCYTGVVGARWREFGAKLDDIASQMAIADRIVAAAHVAFECQHEWVGREARYAQLHAI